MPDDWADAELKLAILQVLLAARKKKPLSGGASGRMLMDCLKLEANIDQLQQSMHWLLDQGLVEAGERVFLIKAKGVDYVAEHLPPPDPPTDPPGPSSSPWSPDDPRRVVRGLQELILMIHHTSPSRKPSGGAGERALPLPDPGDPHT